MKTQATQTISLTFSLEVLSRFVRILPAALGQFRLLVRRTDSPTGPTRGSRLIVSWLHVHLQVQRKHVGACTISRRPPATGAICSPQGILGVQR